MRRAAQLSPAPELFVLGYRKTRIPAMRLWPSRRLDIIRNLRGGLLLRAKPVGTTTWLAAWWSVTPLMNSILSYVVCRSIWSWESKKLERFDHSRSASLGNCSRTWIPNWPAFTSPAPPEFPERASDLGC